MQTKNFLLFIISTLLLFMALDALKRNLWPPPEKKEEETKKAEELSKEKKQARAAGLAGSFAADEAMVRANTPPRSLTSLEKKRVGQAGYWLGMVRSPGLDVPWGKLTASHSSEWILADKPLRPPVVSQPPLEIVLGKDDPEYHLQVTTTSRGGAVSNVILNKFRHANDLGHPTTEVLELIPIQKWLGDLQTPSFALYHYENLKAERPLDTLGKENWKLEGEEDLSSDTQKVAFSRVIDGVKITKTYTLAKREYHLGLSIKMELADPKSDKAVSFRYQLAGARGLPIEGLWYTSSFRLSLIGVCEPKGDKLSFDTRNYQDLRHISLRLGGDAVSKEKGKIIQYAAVTNQYFASVIVVDDDQPSKDFLASARPTLEARVLKVELEGEFNIAEPTLTVKDKDNKGETITLALTPEVQKALTGKKKGAKFGLVCVPDSKDRWHAVKYLSEAETQPLFYDDITVRVNAEAVDVKPGTTVEHKYLLYNGPVKVALLNQLSGQDSVSAELVDRYRDTLHLNTLTDYHSPGWLGSFASAIFWTDLIVACTNLMHKVLWAIHQVVPNYGICIILLTIIVRGLMFPISRKQAMTAMKMQELAPELKKLQQKHKDDRQAYAMAQMELFRKHGVNPLGSCWMLLLQLPIFMGLYYAFQESVHLRLSGFLWIENLAAPDMLFWWGENIPFISQPEYYGWITYLGPYFNVLPILAITLMIMQQKLTMPPPTDEQQAMQQKMMKWMMVIFGVIFYKVASGLCLYFVASTLWGFAERKFLPKKKTDGPAGADVPAPRNEAPQETRPASAEAPKQTGVQTGGRSRRHERGKRRQERTQGQTAGAVSRNEQAPGTKDSGIRKEESENGGGWWAGVRKKMGAWWAEVLKKAEKK